MKKIIFAVFLLSVVSLKSADSQIRVGLNINIGSQPDWGPTGYDHVDYYYIPDIHAYYDVPNREYVYLNGTVWTRSSSLPPRYRNYDIYNGYKVVINQPRPYLHDNIYQNRYASYKGHSSQPIIRNSNDSKYQRPQNNGRPQQNTQQNERVNQGHNGNGNRNDNGNGKGNGNGKDKKSGNGKDKGRGSNDNKR